MDKIAHAGPPRSEADVPTDILASLLIERASAPCPTPHESDSLPPKIYAVMALTSVLTFATLTTGYQLLFSHQLFA
jgi:hypothetical protein